MTFYYDLEGTHKPDDVFTESYTEAIKLFISTMKIVSRLHISDTFCGAFCTIPQQTHTKYSLENESPSQ